MPVLPIRVSCGRSLSLLPHKLCVQIHPNPRLRVYSLAGREAGHLS